MNIRNGTVENVARSIRTFACLLTVLAVQSAEARQCPSACESQPLNCQQQCTVTTQAELEAAVACYAASKAAQDPTPFAGTS
jgi:hypothetical protein